MSYKAEWRARFGEETEPTPDLPDLPWLRQVLMRRTHRRYAERPVPEPLLRLLLGTAFSASSKSDFQQASVIWVRDRQSRDRLAALVPDMPWVGNAPVFLVFCGDPRRLEWIGELRGHTNENGKLEGFFNAAIDHYDDQRLAEAVDGYDRRRDARYSLPREQQRAPDVFGYASFYGWSEDKARQATQPEGESFPSFLRTRGFSLD
jgi:nitroreductase